MSRARVFFSYLFLLIALTSSSIIRSDYLDFDFGFDLDSPDVLDFAAAHAHEASSPFAQASSSSTNQNIKDKEQILQFLSQLGAINILKQDFYLRTNQINTRNLLDLPLFVPLWFCGCRTSFGFYTFYNQSDNKNFTFKRDTINSYLAVGDNGFVEELQNVLAEIEDIGLLDDVQIDTDTVIEILSLFENFTLQERRLGWMLELEKRFEKWNINLMMPIFWREMNYFVNCAIQRALQEILDPITGTPSPEEEEEFQRRFFISDQLGCGDLRVEILRHAVAKRHVTVRVGPQLTVPIGFAFDKGLYGTHFPKDLPRPTIDLLTLYQGVLSGNPQVQMDGVEFLFKAIDRLNAILLDSRLDNGRHLGLGVVAYTETYLSKIIKRPWAECFQFRSRLSIEYLTPSRERIFFIEPNNACAFEGRDFDNEEDPKKICDNFEFIENTIVNRFFPYSFEARVSPGILFRSTSRATYDGDDWGGFLGTDTYIRTIPRINAINITAPVTGVCVDKAESPWIYQSKLFGGIRYRLVKPYREWLLSLGVGQTFMNRGLGEDFTITFNVDVRF